MIRNWIAVACIAPLVASCASPETFEEQSSLGNEGTIDAGTLIIPIEDLKAANITNLNGSMWLALVEDVSPGPGADTMINHCADPESFVEDSSFCMKLAEEFGA